MFQRVGSGKGFCYSYIQMPAKKPISSEGSNRIAKFIFFPVAPTPSRNPAAWLSRWILITTVVGIAAGTSSSLFLFLLEKVTEFREGHSTIILLLPLSGVFVVWLYHRYGKSVDRGNNLLIDEIHDPRETIPLRMAPLVLLGTLLTHLFGGSAGREGTAIQMSGSLSDQISQPLKLSPQNRRILLMAGLSAGFGSVFGTPLAGAFFGMEVLSIGQLKYEALIPCLLASSIAHWVTQAWGTQHTVYSEMLPNMSMPALGVALLLKSIAAGIAFGGAARLFSWMTHGIQRQFKSRVQKPLLRPAIGGAAVAIAIWFTHGERFAGLSLGLIRGAFQQKLMPLDFLQKTLFTAVTLGAGFKGGEVTPLFCIGAALGNALAPLLAMPYPFLAALGFVAVFAGASNTPLACTLLAVELFGVRIGIPAGIACAVSYLFSGHAGIYSAQKVTVRKW